MARIKTEETYEAVMKRIDELFFVTDEKTPVNDPRLLELDLLSELVEEYEQEKYPIEPPLPSICHSISYARDEPLSKRPRIDAGNDSPKTL